ncbi:MAG TPA: ABC transporter permease [Methanoculleus sp.]|nr:ABC transporter permease [Methanoculleus sp.]
MNPMLTVARKEIAQLLHSRMSMLSTAFLAIFFAFTAAPAVTMDGGGLAILDQLLFSMVPVIGLFAGYIFASQIFLREKQQGVIETLLCTPLTVRQLWAGKVLGVTLLAWAMAMGAAILIVGFSRGSDGVLLLPSAPVIVHLAVAVPLFIVAGTGLLGLAQFILGMHQIQIVNVAVIFVLIFLLTLTQQLVNPEAGITWPVAGASFLAGHAALGGVWAAGRCLNTERIVTSLP